MTTHEIAQLCRELHLTALGNSERVTFTALRENSEKPTIHTFSFAENAQECLDRKKAEVQA